MTFEEAASDAGLEFQAAGEVHDPDGEDMDWPSFPEIAGVGVCWADFSGDGYEDLYVANQRFNEENPYAVGYNGLFDPTNRFYENNGDGTFTDRTRASGLESRTFDYGCTGADPDADGDTDLLVTGFGHIKFYRNEDDGTFSDRTVEAGLDISTECLPDACWTTCSAWVDYDGDGWLDLFVCTFVGSSMEDGWRGPANHDAQFNLLFRNNGDGTFTELAEEAGVEGIAADTLGSKSWGAVWFDADLDGEPDLYVTNDMTPNEFYWNNGDGTFTRDDNAGLYDDRAGMGVAAGDTTGDGYPDLFFTHYAAQHNGYYVNDAGASFDDRSGTEGLAEDWLFVGWGTHLVDLDRDGFQDVVVVNGHTEWAPEDYEQKTMLFHQEPQGDGTTKWVDRSNESGPAVLEERVSRGSGVADYDLDGDVDLVIGNNANESLQFLQGSGSTGGFVYVQPVQDGPNHRAIGARVVLEADGVTQSRTIRAGSSFLSQDSLLADFGVRQAERVDRLTVEWPHGNTTVWEDLPVDRVLRVDRETGSVETDTLSPRTVALLNGGETDQRWFAGTIEVALVAEDRAVGPESGLDFTEYRVGAGPWARYGGETLEFPAVEENHTLRFRSRDAVGNVEHLRTERFGVDLTPPVADHRVEGTPGSNGWWMQAELVVEAEDPTSGVDQVRYRLDSGSWLSYQEPVRLGEGVHFVEYEATDRAGNVAERRSVTVKVDPSPPEVSVLDPRQSGVYLGSDLVAELGAGPAVVVTSPEAEGVGGAVHRVRAGTIDETSGVHRVTFSLNGETVADVLDPGDETSWSWNTTGWPAGTYLLHAVVVDRAGNLDSASRFVTLVPGLVESVVATLSEGPSLYPVVPGER